MRDACEESVHSNEVWRQEEGRGQGGVEWVLFIRWMCQPPTPTVTEAVCSPLSPVLKHINCIFTNDNDSAGALPVFFFLLLFVK